MKIAIFFLILTSILLSTHLNAQTIIKEGVKNDTITKTEKIQTSVNNTPRGAAIRLKDITPPKNDWGFEVSYGMAFGNQTTINIVPQIKYSQNIYFTIGGGLNYIYYYLSHNNEKEKMNYLGLNVFARLTPFPYLAFQVQPEILQRWGKQNGRKTSGKIVPTLLAGGGFIIPAGPGNINLLFLFDIIQNKYTPYGQNLYYTLGYSFLF